MMSLKPQFENTHIDVDQLPAYETDAFISLEKNYLKVNMVACGIWALLLIGVYFFFYIVIEGNHRSLVLSLIGVVAAILAIVPFVISYLGFYRKAYALREKDIIYQSGLIWRTTTVIPLNRVQHSEVNHGPIDRMFGLASLKVFTAGGSSSDLSIPGLTESRADQLKAFITRKVGLDEEE